MKNGSFMLVLYPEVILSFFRRTLRWRGVTCSTWPCGTLTLPTSGTCARMRFWSLKGPTHEIDRIKTGKRSAILDLTRIYPFVRAELATNSFLLWYRTGYPLVHKGTVEYHSVGEWFTGTVVVVVRPVVCCCVFLVVCCGFPPLFVCFFPLPSRNRYYFLLTLILNLLSLGSLVNSCRLPPVLVLSERLFHRSTLSTVKRYLSGYVQKMRFRIREA